MISINVTMDELYCYRQWVQFQKEAQEKYPNESPFEAVTIYKIYKKNPVFPSYSTECQELHSALEIYCNDSHEDALRKYRTDMKVCRMAELQIWEMEIKKNQENKTEEIDDDDTLFFTVIVISTVLTLGISLLIFLTAQKIYELYQEKISNGSSSK
jgi:hypothetical protein